MDRSPELEQMLDVIYAIYDDYGLPHTKERL